MRRPKITVTAKIIFAACAAAGLAGCGKTNLGSFDQPDANSSITSRFGNLLSFNKSTTDPVPEKPGEKLECPEIVVLDGTAAHRVYKGPEESNENVQYQYSLADVARECILQGNQIAMKIGVSGEVLLGPVGAPGSFTVPIRIAIVRETDNAPVVSKLYSASVNVPANQTEAPFTIVTEPLLAPFIQRHTADDYIIKVGIDTGSAPAKPAVHEHKKRS